MRPDSGGKEKGGPMTADLLKQAFRNFGIGLRRRLF
jgi:hypothetical protein